MTILGFLRALLCPEPVIPSEHPFTALCHVSGKHIRRLLLDAFPNAYIRIADADYSTVRIDEFNTWLKNDCVSETPYKSGWWDCDNFARKIRCNMFRVNQSYKTEIALAYCEGDSSGGYHAFNVVITNDDNVYVVEPQTDAVVLIDNSKYSPDFIQL